MLDVLRRGNLFSRTGSALLAAVFLFTNVTAVYAQGQVTASTLPQSSSAPVERLDTVPKLLAHLKERAALKRERVEQRIADGGVWERVKEFVGAGSLSLEDTDDVDATLAALDARHEAELKNFADTRARLQTLGLNEKAQAKFHARIDHARQAYLDGRQAMQQHLQVLKTSKNVYEQGRALETLDAFFQNQQFSRSQEPFDPNAPLPFGPGEPAKAREPSTTLDPVSAMQSPVQRTTERLMSAVGDTLIAPAHAAFVPPGAADLGESEEITLSPAIRAKATELHNNPVEIYNWVRNSVEWIPTYGSLQDADATLASQRGNAFAISSLLIALLRAAGIQARYAYGVIEVPIAQAQNWVGGTTNPGAALSVLYQGGIPNAGVVEGGRISAVRMEHIWVEAYVDFVPSRGAKNVAPDTWVELDASFKQYDFSNAIKISDHIQIDLSAHLEEMGAITTTDLASGWVKGVDASVVSGLLGDIQSKLNAYVAEVGPSVSAAELFGIKYQIEQERMALAAGLPYRLISINARYEAIPDQLRHAIVISLSENTAIAKATGEKLFSVTLSLSRAGSSAIAISFVPETPADADVLRSYIPSFKAGDVINPNLLPKTIPGYLVQLKAQFTLDGEVLSEAGSFPLGTELAVSERLIDPARDIPEQSSSIVAGEYLALAVIGNGVNPILVERIGDQMKRVREAMDGESGEEEATDKHTLAGSILQAGILGYFAMSVLMDRISGNSMGVISGSLPSFGVMSSQLGVETLFGVPWRVTYSGVAMDVDRISTLAMDKGGNGHLTRAFYQASGLRDSAYEHLIPEQLFGSVDRPVHGVSAVKLISLAAAQGQKIFTLKKGGATALDQMTIGRSTKLEIAAALNAGKEVTVHERPVSYEGWLGEGYVILDPNTGAGAYKISGGQNGGAAQIDNIAFQQYAISDDAELLGYGVSAALPSAIEMAGAENLISQMAFECIEDLAITLILIALLLALLVRLAPIVVAGALVLARAVFVVFMTSMIPTLAAAGVKPVPTDCGCASGITGHDKISGPQCWICDAGQHPTMKKSVDDAKVAARGMGCTPLWPASPAQRAINAALFIDLAEKREAFNVCWDPLGEGHAQAAREARTAAEKCL